MNAAAIHGEKSLLGKPEQPSRCGKPKADHARVFARLFARLFRERAETVSPPEERKNVGVVRMCHQALRRMHREFRADNTRVHGVHLQVASCNDSLAGILGKPLI